MNKRQKKKCNNTPIATQKIQNGILAEDLLYRPITYDTKSDMTLDFDHIRVPFKIQGEKLFLIAFMDSCDLSVYLECLPLKEGMLSGYCDMSADMKECLEVQEIMGIEYYFGHLNNVYNHYMYVLNILVNKGLINNEKSLELIRDVGFDESLVSQAVDSVEDQLIRNGKMPNVNIVGDMMLEFVKRLNRDDIDK